LVSIGWSLRLPCASGNRVLQVEQVTWVLSGSLTVLDELNFAKQLGQIKRSELGGVAIVISL